MNIDLENLSQDELERLAAAARRKAEEKKAAEKYESLRAEALEAVKNAPAERLPAVLAALKGRGKAGSVRKAGGSKEKSVYRWDEAMGKNRKVDANGNFVEPPVFMRGPAAKNPIHG
jgi:hypothetical protein